MDNYPKILVCSVNTWNKKVGDNTFFNLLEEFPKDNIACLFIREEKPDFSLCQNYFRISEKKIIKSVLVRKEKTGCLVEAAEEEKALLTQYLNKNRFYYPKLFCRELLWKAGKWKTEELSDFIEDFSPDIILYEMSRYIHLNRIILYILKKTKAKGIGCFWDDTFTYKQEKSLGYKALRFFQRGSLKRLAKETSRFFAITPKTKKEADEFFKINSTVLTKPIDASAEYEDYAPGKPIKMLYTGNVGIGRLEVIKKIVGELKKINSEEIKITLEVYTNTPVTIEDKEAIDTKFSKIHPPVTQGEVMDLQKKADVLLFVESLDDENKAARLSFSTKITDYYAAGKCIFAVGNSDLAPMELFCDTDSAITVTSKGELYSKLNLLLDEKQIEAYSKKAFDTGCKNHSYKDIKDAFYKTLSELY